MGTEVPLESRLCSALCFGHRYSQFIWLIKICCMLMELSQCEATPIPTVSACTCLSKLTSRKCCTFLAMDHGAGIPTMCRLDKGHLSPVIKASQQQKPTEAREPRIITPRDSVAASAAAAAALATKLPRRQYPGSTKTARQG